MKAYIKLHLPDRNNDLTVYYYRSVIHIHSQVLGQLHVIRTIATEISHCKNIGVTMPVPCDNPT